MNRSRVHFCSGGGYCCRSISKLWTDLRVSLSMLVCLSSETQHWSTRLPPSDLPILLKSNYSIPESYTCLMLNFFIEVLRWKFVSLFTKSASVWIPFWHQVRKKTDTLFTSINRLFSIIWVIMSSFSLRFHC